MIVITVAMIGELVRGETSATCLGISRSNDHANSIRVGYRIWEGTEVGPDDHDAGHHQEEQHRTGLLHTNA